MEAPGRPPITFSVHDRQTIRPATVKRILCKQAGLDEDTWVATSPEVPNWTVVADSYEQAYQLAEEGVPFALDRDDVELKHFVPAPAWVLR